MDPTLMIGDIVERNTSVTKPVEFPSATASTSTGYPEHKKRWKPSAFKQRLAQTYANSDSQTGSILKTNADSSAQSTGPATPENFEKMERRRIDRENKQKLDDMTPEQIATAQRDLLNGLNPALVQRLLRRANIDEQIEPSPFDTPPIEPSAQAPKDSDTNSTAALPKTTEKKSVTFAAATVEDEDETEPVPSIVNPVASIKSASQSKKYPDNYNEDAEPAQIPSDLFPISDLRNQSTHFPAPPTIPDLDPSDPNFLASLHEKYFPDLPADPSKLAWMAPIPTEDSVADRESSYYPHEEIAVSALRFDFKGRFLSPRVSRSISTSKGLHHHGLAPEAAGYTVAELAILARSAVPAQRCMAFQTLGRVMYRLGRGEWGKTENDPIAMGVWSGLKEGRVLEALSAAASIEGGHRGSQAYATEALWLFEKGGWKEKVKGR